jgi:phosphoglycerate dehydrogenase-like enzyme
VIAMANPIARPSILVLPKPTVYRKLFAPETDQRLRALGSVDYNPDERDLSSVELASRVGGYDIVISGWGSPKFNEPVLDQAHRLKLIAHSAGSIKFMINADALGNGFAVTSVSIAMAPAVAETTLLLIMMSMRGIHKLDARMKHGEDWLSVKATGSGRELGGQRVGVVGAGYVGKHIIKLLGAMSMDVWIYDPYVNEQQAREMGATKVATLDELLVGCPIISLAAPVTDETKKMIGKRELSLLRDGAIFINTARSALVDSDALLAEFKSGRISGALDVFDQEPLPADHPLRKLDNVIMTPHIAAATRDCQLRQGSLTVDEVERLVKGEPLKYAVTKQQYATMA